MQATINGFINHRPTMYEGDAPFCFHPCEMENYGYVTVMPYTMVVDIPDDFDPRGVQIEMLQKKRIEIMAEFQKRCTEIDSQISKLTCLEAA